MVVTTAFCPLTAGRSCMKRIWSCSGSASTLRSWSHPPTAAVSTARQQMGGRSPELGVELRGHLIPPADRRIEELQDSLQKKDADLRAMEERYRRYVDKARTVRMLSDLLPRLLPPVGSCFPPVCTSLPAHPHTCHTSSCHRLLHHGHELSHLTHPNESNSLRGQGHPRCIFPKP